MTGAALERVEQRTTVAPWDERMLRTIEFQGRAIATLDPRCKAIKNAEERRETGIALATALVSLGLPANFANAQLFHLIPGQAPYLSAQGVIATLQVHGYELDVDTNGDRAIVRGRRLGERSHRTVTYTRDEAVASGAFDTWVERWIQDGDRKRPERVVVARDGEVRNRPLPEWAQRELDAGRVKSKDAWFSYTPDMLANRASRRWGKRHGGDAMAGVDVWSALGDDDDDAGGDVIEHVPRRGHVTQPADDDDDGIVDAEVVADEPSTPVSDFERDLDTAAQPVPKPARIPASVYEQNAVKALVDRCEHAGVKAEALAAYKAAGLRSAPQLLAWRDEIDRAVKALTPIVDAAEKPFDDGEPEPVDGDEEPVEGVIEPEDDR